MSGDDFGVAVLGAGGIVARAIVRDLAESEEVSSLLLLDLDGARAQRVAVQQAGGFAGELRAVVIDAGDGAALAGALAGCRVLVNAASYRVNLVAMQAALAAGCDYLDLGGLYWMTARELEPLAPGGIVRFPDPIGEVATIHTLHSELQTFGSSFGVRQASFRLSLAPELLERLEALRDAAEEEVAAAQAAAAAPSARAVSGHVVELVGAGGRAVRVSALTSPIAEWGLGGGIVSTAAPAAALVRLLVRGRIRRVGVHPPERCVDPDDMFPELERRGCRFEVTS